MPILLRIIRSRRAKNDHINLLREILETEEHPQRDPVSHVLGDVIAAIAAIDLK